MMKRFLLMLCCVLMLCQCGGRQETALHDTEGHVIPLASLQGKWLVLNYWATWCEACVREMPGLNAFYRQNKKNLNMLGINFDRLASKRLRLAVRRMHIEFPVIAEDPALFWTLHTPEVLPVTVIIGPDGRIRDTLRGPQTMQSLKAGLQKARQQG